MSAIAATKASGANLLVFYFKAINVSCTLFSGTNFESQPSEITKCVSTNSLVFQNWWFRFKTSQKGVGETYYVYHDIARGERLENAENSVVIGCSNQLSNLQSAFGELPLLKEFYVTKFADLNQAGEAMERLVEGVVERSLNPHKKLKTDMDLEEFGMLSETEEKEIQRVEDGQSFPNSYSELTDRAICAAFSAEEFDRIWTTDERRFDVDLAKHAANLMLLASQEQLKEASAFEVFGSQGVTEIYTDGSCLDNGKKPINGEGSRCAIGVAFGPYHPLNISWSAPVSLEDETNNVAELYAALAALRVMEHVLVLLSAILHGGAHGGVEICKLDDRNCQEHRKALSVVYDTCISKCLANLGGSEMAPRLFRKRLAVLVERPFQLLSDSTYVISSANLYSKTWKYRDGVYRNQSGKAMKNSSIIRTLALLSKRRQHLNAFVFKSSTLANMLIFRKVKAHVGIAGNELANALALERAKLTKSSAL